MKLLAVGLFALASGCAVDEAPPTDSKPMPPIAPRVELLLTDAPGDFESVWVNIASVEIESAETGWQTLVDAPQRFDLLTLQNEQHP